MYLNIQIAHWKLLKSLFQTRWVFTLVSKRISASHETVTEQTSRVNLNIPRIWNILSENFRWGMTSYFFPSVHELCLQDWLSILWRDVWSTFHISVCLETVTLLFINVLFLFLCIYEDLVLLVCVQKESFSTYLTWQKHSKFSGKEKVKIQYF